MRKFAGLETNHEFWCAQVSHIPIKLRRYEFLCVIDPLRWEKGILQHRESGLKILDLNL
jgi:hypothetical protein